jgi:hypothetical protein
MAGDEFVDVVAKRLVSARAVATDANRHPRDFEREVEPAHV